MTAPVMAPKRPGLLAKVVADSGTPPQPGIAPTARYCDSCGWGDRMPGLAWGVKIVRCKLTDAGHPEAWRCEDWEIRP